MAQFLVRKLDEGLVRKLKRRARHHGVSTEEEHRRILVDALAREEAGKPSLAEFLLSDEGAAPEVELEIDRIRQPETRDAGV
jgi:plasmid stability protein